MESISTPLTHFKEQFNFIPEIKNRENLQPYDRIVICGMGGSAISVSLLKLLYPELPISLHNSYGLPLLFEKKGTFLIVNSYSGDTEEELDVFEQGKKAGANMAALSLGGTLIQSAKESGTPYIVLPESSLEPRFSIGHQIVGLLTLIGEERKISLLKSKIDLLDIASTEKRGKELSEKFAGLCPVLYASASTYPVAYLIKAAINEGSKSPAFVNQIPEANHNELQGYVTNDEVTSSSVFGFLLVTSSFDHVRILKRFSIMQQMYEERGFVVSTISINHTDISDIFTLILTGYYMATYTALTKNIDPYKTPFIAEFKKRLAQ